MSTNRTATRKTPDDEPFHFNLDAVKAEADLTPFRFHYNGRRWEMQHLEALDIWELMEAAEKGDAGAMLGAFKAALGDDFDDFRKVGLPQYKMKALFTAWREHCGLNEGESEASAS